MSAGDPSPKVARAPKVKVQPAVYIFAGCAALNSVNLGYDVGINAAIGPPLQDDPALALSDEQLEIFIGSLDFFAIFGALFASAISDKIGRRRAFAVAAVGFDIGIVILVFSNSYGLLMLGRFFSRSWCWLWHGRGPNVHRRDFTCTLPWSPGHLVRVGHQHRDRLGLPCRVLSRRSSDRSRLALYACPWRNHAGGDVLSGQVHDARVAPLACAQEPA
mmetsp:Transcript_95873/g.158126  ORF Transcript_95873/g.158126 Transcript_95873/m.158126 type:complete len:218 (+) Transcript_95873:64-717(+)